MVQAAPDVHPSKTDDVDQPYISPTRGGGHAGIALGFFVAAQAAPIVSILLALALVSGEIFSSWWLWTVVAVVAVPAALVFLGSVFLAEHGLELE